MASGPTLGGSTMAFRITITDEAEMQSRALPAREQRTLEAAIIARLRDRPTTPTKAIKRVRPNPVAEFELRAGDLRVLYDVVDEEVVLLIIGRRVGNTLIVDGEEFHEHQADPTESAGGGSAGDPE
jgi:mRNA-degrading endonuclease RelE of RelBE toxin-antitoxin system